MQELLEAVQQDKLEIRKYHENENMREKVDKDQFMKKVQNNQQTNKAMTDLIEEFKDYTWEEKFEWMLQKKAKGNRLYTQKKSAEAVKHYMECLYLLDYDRCQEEKDRQTNEIQFPILTNLATCMRERKEYYKAIELCSQAIKLKPNNFKAYFKRAGSYMCVKDYDNAKQDYKKALSLCKDESYYNEIRKDLEKIKAYELKKQQAFKGFLNKGGLNRNNYRQQVDSEDTEDDDENQNNDSGDVENGNSYHTQQGGDKVLGISPDSDEEENILEYNDEWEELPRVGPLRYVVYPFKLGFNAIKSRMPNWCSRRKQNYDKIDI